MGGETPTRIGPYEVFGEIGRGGMGIVYRARDARLDRHVAIKALPEALAGDAARLERFEREGRALAQLNHPGVAGIYGIEEQDGQRYLVLEYIDGETLGERLAAGPLPLDDALEVAIGIAAGLEAAHDAGVIHRDLKPDNVKITPDGQVKVLDFGLAKSCETAMGANAVDLESPTVVPPRSPTVPGAILGTAAYMSPEQARGRGVDKRTDIWSFGVLLYECLTGASPFAGETASDSIAAVLQKEVDLDRLPAHTPAAARRTIARCLRRDPNERLRDIGDARLELAEAGREPLAAEERSADGRSTLWVAGAAIAGIVAGMALGSLLTRGAASVEHAPESLHVELLPPAGSVVLATGDVSGPAVVSPDGTTIAYSARDEDNEVMIWVRRLNEPDARPLDGTEHGVFPFWSPDSRSLGFFDADTLRRVDVTTGLVRDVCAAPAGRGGTWTADDAILFSPDLQAAIVTVAASGEGEPVQLTTVDPTRHTTHRWPCVLPDDRHFVFIAVHHDSGRADDNAIFLASRDGGEPVELLECDYGVEVVDDQILFVRGGVLFAARLDAAGGRVSGTPIELVGNVAADLSIWRAAFSASPAGVLAYHRVGVGSDVRGRRAGEPTPADEGNGITLVMRDGRAQHTHAAGVPTRNFSVARDGRQIAVAAKLPGLTDFDIWIFGTAYSAQTIGQAQAVEWGEGWSARRRVTDVEGLEVGPVFSPDGSELVYGRVFGSSGGLYRKHIGGGREELLVALQPMDGDPDDMFPTDWSSDGRFIVFLRGDFIGRLGDVWVYPVAGGDAFPLIERSRACNAAQLSPDGRWLAYTERVAGVREIYVEPFTPGWDEDAHPLPPAGSRWRISVAGGIVSRWSNDGTELFYATRDGSVHAVPVDTQGATFAHDVGNELFQSAWQPGSDFDVFPGAEAFAFNSWMTDEHAPVSLVLNWQTLIGNAGTRP